jgi:(heptosyl)LPS beta-1,4-glucosyltransferase
MTAKATISVLLIAKNEAHNLADCLASVAWADQIVVLDSGSVDGSEAIVKRHGAEFHQQTNWQGFGRQRQRAQEFARCDWIFWIDADERVTETLKEQILKVVAENNPDACYKVNRLSQAFGKVIRHSGWHPDWIVRLYPRELTQYNDALVHESIVVPKECPVRPLKGDLLHYTVEALSQHTQKTAGYMKAWADQREGKKRAGLGSAVFHAFFRFFKMYILKRGFLDGRHGLLLAILSANVIFTRYADLWLREYVKQQKRKQS